MGPGGGAGWGGPSGAWGEGAAAPTADETQISQPPPSQRAGIEYPVRANPSL